MAKTITISNQSISNSGIPQRNNVFLQSAEIHYQCSAVWSGTDTTSDPGPSASATGVSTSTSWRVYCSEAQFVFNWTIKGQTFNNAGSSGDKLVNKNFGEYGTPNTITASVSVTGTYTPYTQAYTRTYYPNWQYENPGHGSPGDDDYEAPSGKYDAGGTYSAWQKSGEAQPGTAVTVGPISANCTSITVYTRPGTFSDFSFDPDTIIEKSPEGLTATKVSNWVTHCNAFNSWYNQSANTSANSCTVTTGDYITAAWYNSCVSAIADSEARPSTVTGGANGTIITTSVIGALGEAISKDDST